MRALIQRVSEAQVLVEGQTVGNIGTGMLALVGVQPGDDQIKADALLEKLLGYRIFADGQGKMNLSLQTVQGGLLLVPQFTLAADTRSGLRPSFSSAALPEQGEILFKYLVGQAYKRHTLVATGCFGAHMQVQLVNDGPVTFLLEV